MEGIDKYPDHQSSTFASQPHLTELNPSTHHEKNLMTRNLQTLLRRTTNDSPSPVNKSYSESQHLLRLPSFPENTDTFDLQRDSLSPSSSLSSTVHEVNFLNDRVQSLESEKLTLMVDHNNLIREFNKRMQSHLEETRTLKEVNQTIEQELSELRDLCCFLDDDRRKCRKLAKEWQKFGRHTVSTLKSEISAYQERQLNLETKHAHVLQENSELRDLCFHLDQHKSSNENNLDETDATPRYIICPDCSSQRNISDKSIGNGEISQTNPEKMIIMQNKVDQLEKEKDMLHRLLMYGGKTRKEKKRVSFTFPDDGCDSSSTASELDMFDFPPSAMNFELFSRSNNILDSTDIIHENGVCGLNNVTSSYNRMLSNSLPKLTSEMSLQLNGDRGLHLKNENTNNISINLPPYEESVKYLEISKENQLNSGVKYFADKEIESNEV